MASWEPNITGEFATAAVLGAILLIHIPRSLVIKSTNFEGRRIFSAGLLLSIALTAGAATAWWLSPSTARLALLVAAFGFGILGFIDDSWGNREVSGLRGHVTAALRGHITTGFVKLAGGALLAVACATMIGAREAWILADAAVIALWANAINLVDTRPVRAVFATSISALPSLPVSFCILAAAVCWWPLERRRVFMLGDAGSNALGAACGAAFLITVPPASARLAVLVLLIAFHLWTERYSLNALIDGDPTLARFDRWIQGTPPSQTGV